MSFLKRIAVLFYVTLIMFIPVVIFFFEFHIITYENVCAFFYAFYVDETLKLIALSIAGVILIMNYMFYALFSVSARKSKVIAFDNPSGKVSVSIQALEDLVRRTLLEVREIKECKPKITANKKKLNVSIRITLRMDQNIPETTSKVQDLALKKVQDTVGVETDVDVSVYVGKILPEHIKFNNQPKNDDDSKGPNVPFQGYRP